MTNSPLQSKTSKIAKLLARDFSQTAIAEICEVSRQAMSLHIAKTPKLKKAFAAYTERKAKIAAENKAERHRDRDAYMLKKYGYTDAWRKEPLTPQRASFMAKRNNAKRQGVEFTTTFNDIEYPTHCPALGIKLVYSCKGGQKYNSATFDRLNPKKGYVKGNVVVISHRANCIKTNASSKEIIAVGKFFKSLGY